VIEGILDTNIIIDFLLSSPTALRWGASVSHQTFGLTSIVWFEVLNGARNKVEMAQMIKFTGRFPIVTMNSTDEMWAREQFRKFHLSHGVEYADVMIAAVAVRLNVPLYTRNMRHFRVLPDLDVRQPY
jgi:predicted nucleic acid-binding protein